MVSIIAAAVITLMMAAASFAGTPSGTPRPAASSDRQDTGAAVTSTLPTWTTSTSTLPAWSTSTTSTQPQSDSGNGTGPMVEGPDSGSSVDGAHVASTSHTSRSKQPPDAAAKSSQSSGGSTQSTSTSTTSTTTTTEPSGASDPTCQGSNPLGLPGSWDCTFDDEFNGTSLNTNNWTPQVTAASGYVNGATACYADSPNTISVGGGYLSLTALQVAPFTCQDGSNSFTTSYEAGMVSTSGLFDQTYGAFEVNAKLPPSVVEGLQETMWLYPQTLTYGAWPDSGEIDFAEFYSEFPGLDVPYIHYADSSTDPNVTSYDCLINQDAFNTYGVDWTPTSITVLYNGQPCLVDTPSTGGEPFNQPFFIALTQALGVGTNAFTPETTQLPATTEIDWVRAWAPAS